MPLQPAPYGEVSSIVYYYLSLDILVLEHSGREKRRGPCRGGDRVGPGVQVKAEISDEGDRSANSSIIMVEQCRLRTWRRVASSRRRRGLLARAGRRAGARSQQLVVFFGSFLIVSYVSGIVYLQVSFFVFEDV